jgi:hypothetical protein
MSLEDDLVTVWRQVMVEDGKTVTLGEASYPVRRTSRSKLREVDVKLEGKTLRAVEQNPQTNSRWAQLARQGKKVMQFMEDRRYVAVVVDGKLTLYGHRGSGKST